MTSDPKILSSLAAAQSAYEQATGMIIPPMIQNEFIWAEFLRHGFKPEDIKTVVAYMRREFSRCIPPSTTPTWKRMVRWPRFITDAPEFAGYLALARASARNIPKPPSARQAALHAVGRREPEPEQVKTPNDIVGTMVTPEDWAKWAQKTMKQLDL